MALLLAGVLASSAAVTVQGWWHYGELSDFYGDSSGNGHRFGSAFSRVGSGNAGVGVMPFGCGGPLGASGYISTNCLYWTPTHADAAGMWNPGFNPPATNYVIECWCLPEWPGTRGGNGAWLFGSGSSGGVRFQLTNADPATAGSTMAITAMIIGNNVVIGDPVIVDTNRWTHLAVVNDNGTQTFYVNGVAHGAPNVGNATVPGGDIYGGSAPGTQPTFAGYLDELRISTFAPGQFSTADLLARPMAPNIIAQPQSASVWNGGAAPFRVGVAFDNSTTYQWRRGGANLGGATSSEFYLNTVGTGDNAAQFDVVLNNYSGISKTSSVATLTVVNPNPSNIAAYRDAINAEPGLVGYFPVDGDTGTTLSNTKDPAHNGTLEGTAEFDGRTDRAYGVRALRLKNTGDGDVQIPNNAAFEFASGNGTIEAIVYLEQAQSSANRTIFAMNLDGGTYPYYQIQASADGSSMIYADDITNLVWAVSPPLLGRQAHVAVVFASSTATAYVDGLSLGAKPHPTFGSSPGVPAWIGSLGLNTQPPNAWSGTIDELAIYGSALSANTIAIHNSKFLYGTNTASPTITALPGTGSKTLLAGGSASFKVGAAGTAPLSYQWTVGGNPILGATTDTLTLSPTTILKSGIYGVTVSNPYGTTNSPTFSLTFVAPTDRYATMVMGDNPLAFWRMDETSGTTCFDSAGGHDGTYSGSFTFGAPALPNMSDAAIHLTGGYATIPYSPALNPSTAFSVEFWAKPDVQTIYAPMSSQYRSGSARQGWCFYMENDADSWEIHLGNSGGVSLYAYGGGPVPLPGQFYHVVEVYDGAGNSTLYAENQLVGHNTQVALGGTYVPNPSAPLMIGVRNGGGFPFNGIIDEVAIYNYALTTAQISNHWSIKFQPAAIVTPPAGVTTNEWANISLSAQASGFPNTYKWQKGGVDLVETSNPDGTAHYPNGVTNTTLVIAQAHPADGGQYRMVVSNPLGGATTANASVVVTADTSKLAVAKFEILGTPNPSGPTPFVAKVIFNKKADPTTGGALGNYAISGGATPASVTLSADNMVAYLVTSGFAAGQKYSVTVTGVLDQSQTPNTSDTTPAFGWAPVLTQGVALWDFYANITPQGVDNLLGSQYYPNAPYTNLNTTVFDSTQITTGDLNNTVFGALGDNYGCSLSGWITPTVTTNYNFFLASDDASRLYLSTDATPQNAVQIAEEAGCCHGFQETNNPTTSLAIPLQAGVSYFIRAVQTEGSGGDYVKVAWRIDGLTNAPATLSPIASTYLKAYAPLPAPRFDPPVLTGGQVKITWSGGGTLLESTDMTSWTAVAGSPTSPYTVNASTAGKKFYRVVRQ